MKHAHANEGAPAVGERLYRIHVVAQRVGLSESLIRAWERRYRIVEPRRTPSGYRAYSERDLELLRRVKQLTDEGMAIGDVRALLPGLRREVDVGPTQVGAPPGDIAAQFAAWRASLVGAGRSNDQARAEEILDEALRAHASLEVYRSLMVPALVQVGDLWHSGELSVAQEHLVTHAVRGKLLSLVDGVPRASRGHVLCACLPEEDHDIGLLGVALRFRLARFRVTFLGQRAPLDDVLSLASSVAPSHLALSARLDPSRAPHRVELLRLVRRLPPSTKLLLGGRGFEQRLDLVGELGGTLVRDDDWDRVLA